MTPTDADRETAREIARQFRITLMPQNRRELTIGLVLEEATALVAAAIAAARAEGFEAGLREPERRAREFLGDPAKGVSGHGK